MERSISFLIAAHNEEKLIERTLSNLINLPYENYEIIVGLDGCTDDTLKIVKKFSKKSPRVKYIELDLREGKPVVIDTLMKNAKGKIIVINDADWIFKCENKKMMLEYFSVFDDPSVGAIAESFPVEWNANRIKGNLGFRMVAYGNYLWLNFQKEKYAYKKNKKLYVKEPSMFLTNIFRRELYQQNRTLGDDFERTIDISKRGFEIVLFEDPNMPRMIASYNCVSLKDLFVQKTRTAVARNQLKNKTKITLKNYYIPAIFYILKESWKREIKVGFITSFWIFLTTIATIYSNFKKNKSTKEGWKLRASRE